MIKVIKTEAEYEAALSAIEVLVEEDPSPGSADAEKLELLTLLVQDYENRTAPPELPEPISAIRFRMEQLGLSQKDLIPYIGNKSKVSEVLSGKRPLSIGMIRALHNGLGIPAHVLVREDSTTSPETTDVNWDRFPVADMARRGWLSSGARSSGPRRNPRKLLAEFFEPVGVERAFAGLHRKSLHVRAARTMDTYALVAWTAQILRRALAAPQRVRYDRSAVTGDFLRTLVQSSLADDGPLRAQKLLDEIGITVIIEPHLPKTHLDGAAVLLNVERPVIGLTLRHDRLDSFWFTLLHEVAHIVLHLGEGADAGSAYYDDLDVGGGEDPREYEADAFARESLIPDKVWLASPASKVRAPSAIVQLAAQLNIHPAIVAGRVRHQYKDYRVFGDLIGGGRVRQLFPDAAWS